MNTKELVEEKVKHEFQYEKPAKPKHLEDKSLYECWKEFVRVHEELGKPVEEKFTDELLTKSEEWLLVTAINLGNIKEEELKGLSYKEIRKLL